MTVPQIRLVVGLGNPGAGYDHTPHNLGFEVLETLAQRHGLRFRRAFGLQAWGGTWHDSPPLVRLLKPRTFMNRSGVAVRKALRRWRIPPGEMLVVYDDVALPAGKLRLRLRGGAGGHNGMTSVIRELDNFEDFPRLRLGAGPRPPGDQLVSYLLSPWPESLDSVVVRMREAGADVLECVMREGLTTALNNLNPDVSGTNASE